MKCSEVEKLNGHEPEVQAHLETCAACRASIKFVQAARSAPVPTNLKANIRQVLAASPRPEKDRKKVNNAIRGISLTAIGLATSMAVAFVAFKPAPSLAAVFKKVAKATQSIHTVKETCFMAATPKWEATTHDLYITDTEILFSAGPNKYGSWSHKWPLSEHIFGSKITEMIKSGNFDSVTDNGIQNGQRQIISTWTDLEPIVVQTSGSFRSVTDIDPESNLIVHSTIEERGKTGNWEIRYDFKYQYNVEIPKGEIVFRDGQVLDKVQPPKKQMGQR